MAMSHTFAHALSRPLACAEDEAVALPSGCFCRLDAERRGGWHVRGLHEGWRARATQALEKCPANEAHQLYQLYAKLEEEHGLMRNAMSELTQCCAHLALSAHAARA